MKRVYLKAIGPDVSFIFNAILPRLEAVFNLETGTLPLIEIPPRSYNSERGQYYSSAMLLLIERGLPHDALRVLGITAVDLYIPQLNFVFGEARLGGPSAVISIHRLRPEFYGEPPDEKQFLRRVEIEAVHELGHTFGLGHCPKPNCVMHFSNNIADTDRKGPRFCGDCRLCIAGAIQKQTAGLA